MKILVVDDDQIVRESIRRILVRECDADVSLAANGLDALDYLTRHECDLVLLDLQMPGLDGMKTLQAIRRTLNRQTLPVVILTGTANEGKVRESASYGVQGYLLKPVQPEALVNRLSKIIVRTSTTQSATRD